MFENWKGGAPTFHVWCGVSTELSNLTTPCFQLYSITSIMKATLVIAAHLAMVHHGQSGTVNELRRAREASPY